MKWWRLRIKDIAPTHKTVVCTNVTVLFLPPNSTSKIQPMDSGIISCFKRNYIYIKKYSRRTLRTKLIIPHKVDQLTAMNWCVAEWNRVTPDTIANCFGHTNLIDVGKTSRNDQINSSVAVAARLS